MNSLSDDVKKWKKKENLVIDEKLSSSQFQFIFFLSIKMCQKKRETFVRFPHNSSRNENNLQWVDFLFLHNEYRSQTLRYFLTWQAGSPKRQTL